MDWVNWLAVERVSLAASGPVPSCCPYVETSIPSGKGRTMSSQATLNPSE